MVVAREVLAPDYARVESPLGAGSWGIATGFSVQHHQQLSHMLTLQILGTKVPLSSRFAAAVTECTLLWSYDA